MTKHSLVLSGVLAALAMSTSVAFADDTIVSMIQCGDAMPDGYDGFIKTWEDANPGYKVEVQLIGWDQCQDKATTLAAAGDPVAIAYMGSRTLKQLAQNDLIIPVPMTDAEKAGYFPFVAATVTFGGTQWGVPVAFSTKSMYWNKDLFKQAGLDPESPPTTWDELYNDAKTIKDKLGIAGYGLPAKTFDSTMHEFLHFVYTNNGTVIDDAGNITLDSPENLAALEFYKKLVGVAEEGPTALNDTDVHNLFADSKVAIEEGGPWYRNRMPDGMNWGVAPLPVGPSATGPGTLLITDSLAVFKGSGVEEQAVSLAKFLTNPENQSYYEKTQGLTPLRPGPAVDALIAGDATWKPFIDGISHGGPEPLFTEYKPFQDAMITMIQSVVTGDAEPADALKTAAAAIEEDK